MSGRDRSPPKLFKREVVVIKNESRRSETGSYSADTVSQLTEPAYENVARFFKASTMAYPKPNLPSRGAKRSLQRTDTYTTRGTPTKLSSPISHQSSRSEKSHRNLRDRSQSIYDSRLRTPMIRNTFDGKSSKSNFNFSIEPASTSENPSSLQTRSLLNEANHLNSPMQEAAEQYCNPMLNIIDQYLPSVDSEGHSSPGKKLRLINELLLTKSDETEEEKYAATETGTSSAKKKANVVVEHNKSTDELELVLLESTGNNHALSGMEQMATLPTDLISSAEWTKSHADGSALGSSDKYQRQSLRKGAKKSTRDKPGRSEQSLDRSQSRKSEKFSKGSSSPIHDSKSIESSSPTPSSPETDRYALLLDPSHLQSSEAIRDISQLSTIERGAVTMNQMANKLNTFGVRVSKSEDFTAGQRVHSKTTLPLDQMENAGIKQSLDSILELFFNSDKGSTQEVMDKSKLQRDEQSSKFLVDGGKRARDTAEKAITALSLQTELFHRRLQQKESKIREKLMKKCADSREELRRKDDEIERLLSVENLQSQQNQQLEKSLLEKNNEIESLKKAMEEAEEHDETIAYLKKIIGSAEDSAARSGIDAPEQKDSSKPAIDAKLLAAIREKEKSLKNSKDEIVALKDLIKRENMEQDSQIDKMDQENVRLKKRLKVMQNDLDRTKAELRKTKNKVDNRTKENEEVSQKINEKDDALQFSSMEISRLKKELHAAQKREKAQTWVKDRIFKLQKQVAQFQRASGIQNSDDQTNKEVIHDHADTSSIANTPSLRHADLLKQAEVEIREIRRRFDLDPAEREGNPNIAEVKEALQEKQSELFEMKSQLDEVLREKEKIERKNSSTNGLEKQDSISLQQSTTAAPSEARSMSSPAKSKSQQNLKLREALAECKHLSRNLSEAKKETSKLRKKITDQRTEIENLQNSSVTDIERVSRDLNMKDAELMEVQTRLEMALRDKHSSDVTVNDLREALERAKEEAARLNGDRWKAQEKNDVQSKTSQRELSSLKEQVSSLLSQLSTARQRRDEALEQVSLNSEKVESLSKQLAETRMELQEKHDEGAKISHSLEVVLAEKEVWDKKIQRMEAEAAVAEAEYLMQIKEKDTAIVEMTEELQRLKLEGEKQESLQARVVELEHNLVELRHDRDSIAKKWRSEEYSKAALSEEIAAKSKHLEEKVNENAVLSSRLRESELEMNRLKANLDHSEIAKATLKRERNEAVERLKVATKTLKEKDDALCMLTESLASTQVEFQDLQSTSKVAMKAAEGDTASLQEQVTALQQELEGSVGKYELEVQTRLALKLDLEKHKKDLNRRVVVLEEKLKDSEMQGKVAVEASERQNALLVERLERVTVEISEVKKERDSVVSSYEAQVQDRVALLLDINRTKADLETSRLKIEEFAAERQKLNLANEQIRKAKNKLQEELDGERQHNLTLSQEKDTETGNLKEELLTVIASLEEQSKRVNDLSTERALVEGELGTIKLKFEYAERERDEVVAKLEAEVKERIALFVDLEEMKTEMKAKASTLKDLSSQIRDFEAKKHALNQEISKRDKEMIVLKGETSRRTHQLEDDLTAMRLELFSVEKQKQEEKLRADASKDDMEQEVSSLRKELSVVKSKLDSMEMQRDDAQKNYESVVWTKEEFSLELQKSKDELTASKALCEHLAIDVDKLKMLQTKFEERTGFLESELAQLQALHTRALDDAIATEAALREELSNACKREEAATEEMKKQTEALEQANQTLADLEEKVIECEKREKATACSTDHQIVSLNAQLADLEDNLSESEKKVNQLQESYNNEKVNTKGLSSELAITRTELKSKVTDLSNSNDVIATFESKVSQLEASIGVYAKEVSSLKGQLATAEGLLVASDDKNHEIHAKFNEEYRKAASVSSDLKATRSELERARAEITQLTSRAKDLGEKKEQCEEKIRVLLEEKDAMEIGNKTSLKRNADARAELAIANEELLVRIDRKAKKLTVLQESLKVLEAENADLRNELAERNSRYVEEARRRDSIANILDSTRTDLCRSIIDCGTLTVELENVLDENKKYLATISRLEQSINENDVANLSSKMTQLEEEKAELKHVIETSRKETERIRNEMQKEIVDRDDSLRCSREDLGVLNDELRRLQETHQVESKKKRKEMAALQVQIATAQNEICKTELQRDEANEKYVSVFNNEKALIAKLERMKIDLECKNLDVKRLSSRLQHVISTKDKFQEEMKRMQKEIDSVKGKDESLHQKDIELGRARREVQKLQDEAAYLREQENALLSETRRKISLIREELSQCRKEISILTNERDKLARTYDSEVKKCESLSSSLDSTRSRLREKTAEVDKLSRKLEEVMAEKDDCRKNISILEMSLVENDNLEKVANYEETLSSAKAQVEKLQSELAKSQEREKTLSVAAKTKIEHLEAKLSKAQSGLSEQKDSLDNLDRRTAEVCDLSSKLEWTEVERDEYAEKLSHLERTVELLQADLAFKEDALKRSQVEVSGMKDEVRKGQEQIDSMLQENKAMMEELTNLRAALEKAQNASGKVCTDCELTKADLEQRISDIAKLSWTLEQVIAEKEKLEQRLDSVEDLQQDLSNDELRRKDATIAVLRNELLSMRQTKATSSYHINTIPGSGSSVSSLSPQKRDEENDENSCYEYENEILKVSGNKKAGLEGRQKNMHVLTENKRN